MIEKISELWPIIGIPVARSAAGWANKALEDNKITKFEMKKLSQTVVRVGVIGLMTYLGFNELGFDVSALGASASAFLIDVVAGALRDNKNVRQ